MVKGEGQKAAIFYNDLSTDEFGKPKVARKDGIITAVSDNGVTLDDKHLIPWQRIIRIEFNPKQYDYKRS